MVKHPNTQKKKHCIGSRGPFGRKQVLTSLQRTKHTGYTWVCQYLRPLFEWYHYLQSVSHLDLSCYRI